MKTKLPSFVLPMAATLAMFSTGLDGAEERPKPSQYPSAEIWIEHPGASGLEARPGQKVRIEDPEIVTGLASHFPGILAAKGNGPRTEFAWKSAVTVIFHPAGGEPESARVAHLSPDFSEWNWRDNPPYTGARNVRGPEELLALIRRLLTDRQLARK